MKKNERKGMLRNTLNANRNKKLFSFSMLIIIFLASFTVAIIITPSIVEAGDEGPSEPSPKTLTTYSTNMDTMIRKAYPTSHSWENQIDMYVDYKFTQIDRSFVKFTTSSIPSGSVIQDAELRLRIRTNSGATGRYHDCHEVDLSWTETSSSLTWNNYNDEYRLPRVAREQIPSSGYCYWDVTDSVQGFVDGTANNGWMISDANEGLGLSKYIKYYTSEYTGSQSTYHPRLVVTYIEPPECQTNDIQAGGVGETSATLRGQVTDDGGDYCNYQFSYNRGTVSGSGAFSQSTGILSRGRRYYYQAKLKNDAGDGSLGSPEKSFLTAPGAITEFTATSFDIQQINLTWTNGAMAAMAPTSNIQQVNQDQ